MQAATAQLLSQHKRLLLQYRRKIRKLKGAPLIFELPTWPPGLLDSCPPGPPLSTALLCVRTSEEIILTNHDVGAGRYALGTTETTFANRLLKMYPRLHWKGFPYKIHRDSLFPNTLTKHDVGAGRYNLGTTETTFVNQLLKTTMYDAKVFLYNI